MPTTIVTARRAGLTALAIAAGLVADDLYSFDDSCLDLAAWLADGQTAELEVDGPTWLGFEVARESVYRITAAGPDRTALAIWMIWVDSGSDCRLAAGSALAEAEISGGSAVFDWSAGNWGDAVEMTPPVGAAPATMTVSLDLLAARRTATRTCCPSSPTPQASSGPSSGATSPSTTHRPPVCRFR